MKSQEPLLEEPQRLPGRSGCAFLILGLKGEAATLPFLALIAFESYLPGPTVFWQLFLAPAAIALVIWSVTVQLRGYRKLAAEQRLGYTTALGYAKKDPGLFYVDPRTLEVSSPPHTARPKRH